MQKMHKFLPLLVVALLLALCVVPVGAADESDSPDEFAFGAYKESYFPFDYIILNDGPFADEIVTWPFNYLKQGSTLHVSLSQGWMSGGCSSDSMCVEAMFPGSSSLSLYSQLIFLSDYSNLSLSSSHENLRFSKVSITGRLQIPAAGKYFNEYDLQDYELDFSVDMISGGVISLDIDGFVRQAVDSCVSVNQITLPDNSYFYLALRNLIITVDYFNDDDVSDPVLRFDSDVKWCGNDRLGLWLSSWELPAPIPIGNEVADMDFGWLSDSVGGFFEMHIAPGISLNTLFWVVLVISVMVLVITRFT